MRILTIIVSYNFLPWMDRCIGSLLQSETPTDILVLDNGSKDNTVETLKEKYPQVRVIDNGANLGFGRANNKGIMKAVQEGYDGVFLLNEDAWVNPDTIGTLAQLSVQHPEYGIISPVHLTANGMKLDYGFSVYTSLADKDSLPSQELVAVPFINAAMWYMPVSAIKRVGMFAPVFYHYGEDKDFCNRMAHFHLLIGYCPKVFGYHDREFRQTDRAAWLRAERVYFLSEYANLNRGLPSAFAYSVLAALKKSFLAAVKLHFRDAASLFGIAFWLFSRSGAVLHSRNICSHVDLKNFV